MGEEQDVRPQTPAIPGQSAAEPSSPDQVTGPDGSDGDDGDGVEPGTLSERDRDILEFERQWWKHAGAKERAVRDRFGFSATRYFQVLNTLLDRPEALEHDPMLVQRLRRLREARQHARSTVRRPGR
jgi:uncharacterized protein DUF3263